MSNTKIKITPEELIAQAIEMNALQERYSDLFGNVTFELYKVNSHWSTNLAHNFYVKITSLKQIFSQITKELINGANVAKICSETFESVDSQLVKLYKNDGMLKKLSNEETMVEAPKPVDMEYYMRNVKDAEYTLLCHYWSQAAQSDNPLEAFLRKIQNLPKNDPIRELTASQLTYVNSPTGFSAITIKDGNGNAIVIFAGTNGDVGDIIADAKLTFNISPYQSKEAIGLVNAISKECNNVVVTGHSLGGYLATSATLKNSAVKRCIAFDPPGRHDVLYQNIVNKSSVKKITTYEANRSLISSVGASTGREIRLDVEENGGAFDHNHGIFQISDALGGVSEENWAHI